MTDLEKAQGIAVAGERPWISVVQHVRWVAAWLAAALILPMLLHPFGLGPKLLPMHIPVLLAGATQGPTMGALVGALAPWLSYLTTGMPPLTPPIAPFMVLELMTYGAVAGALRRSLPPGLSQGFFASYLWLLPSLLAGRLTLATAVWGLGPFLGLVTSPVAYVQGTAVEGLPGLVAQLILVPIVLRGFRDWTRPDPPGTGTRET